MYSPLDNQTVLRKREEGGYRPLRNINQGGPKTRDKKTKKFFMKNYLLERDGGGQFWNVKDISVSIL